MSQAVIALGSNIGDRIDNLRQALHYLSAAGVSVLAKSRVYQTEPWGYKDQDDFLNAAVLVDTIASPQELLAITQGIERKMGRDKKFLNGPRNIDLDILVYEDREVCESNLVIPHPRIRQRLFVLCPMADIVPDWPMGNSRTVAQLLAAHPHDERIDITDLSL